MVQNTWFLNALKDLSEFAEEEKIEGVLEGLSVALETYANEAGVDVDQHNEILKLLGGDRSLTTQVWETSPQGDVASSQLLQMPGKGLNGSVKNQ
ncbi:MAG: hypothetical protein ABJI96_11900 [Paracoccaceae bacterium]